MDEGLIIEIWDAFKDHIPEKNRELAANQYVNFLLEHDISTDDLEGYLGYDKYLDDAIHSTLKEEDSDDDEYFEDEDE